MSLTMMVATKQKSWLVSAWNESYASRLARLFALPWPAAKHRSALAPHLRMHRSGLSKRQVQRSGLPPESYQNESSSVLSKGGDSIRKASSLNNNDLFSLIRMQRLLKEV